MLPVVTYSPSSSQDATVPSLHAGLTPFSQQTSVSRAFAHACCNSGSDSQDRCSVKSERSLSLPMHADASSNPRANTLRMLPSVRPFPTPRKVNGGAACP